MTHMNLHNLGSDSSYSLKSLTGRDAVLNGKLSFQALMSSMTTAVLGFVALGAVSSVAVVLPLLS